SDARRSDSPAGRRMFRHNEPRGWFDTLPPPDVTVIVLSIRSPFPYSCIGVTATCRPLPMSIKYEPAHRFVKYTVPVCPWNFSLLTTVDCPTTPCLSSIRTSPRSPGNSTVRCTVRLVEQPAAPSPAPPPPPANGRHKIAHDDD